MRSLLRPSDESLRAGPARVVLDVFIGAPAEVRAKRGSPRADLRPVGAARGQRESREVREGLALAAAHHPGQR